MKKVIIWLILCLIWGTTWIFIKIGLADLPPIAFAAARFLLAVVILFFVIRIQKIPLPKTAKEWSLIALTGVLQFSINYSLVFWSEQYITSGLAAVLQATITVFGLILAWFFLPNERITKLKIFAVGLGIIGVAVIFIDQLKVQNLMAFLGSVGIVIGAYAAAQASILVKAKASAMHPAALVFAQIICGLPAIIIYSLVAEGNPFTFHWTWRAVVCVLYLSVFGTVAAFWLYYWLLSKIESTKAMMISLVTPLLAVIIGAIFLGERLPPQWTGLKFFNVFGPNEYHKGTMMSVLARRFDDVKAGRPVQLFKSHREGIADGDQRRDFIYVDDVVRVMMWLLATSSVSGLFNVGTGTARSFRDLMLSAYAALGATPNIQYIDMPEAIRGSYQYFTQSEVDRLLRAGYNGGFTALEDAVGRYVKGFLDRTDRFR